MPENRGDVESLPRSFPEVTMMMKLTWIGAKDEGWDSAVNTPVCLLVKEKNSTTFLHKTGEYCQTKEWSKECIKTIALISLKGCIVNPLVDIAIIVEGVVRAIAGALVWGASWIPSTYSETLQKFGEKLIWSAHIGVAGGLFLLAEDAGTIPLCLTRIVRHTWGLLHESADDSDSD